MVPDHLAARERRVAEATDSLGSALQSMDPADLDLPLELPGWTGRHLVAHLAYNGIALGRLVDWAATGVETPMYSSPEARDSEIVDGARQTPDELRHLFDTSAADLARRWAALPADRWSHPVRTAQGRTVPVAETLWMRIREVWIHGVDLGILGFADFPQDLVADLLEDVTGLWHRRAQPPSLIVRPDDLAQEYRVIVESSEPTVVAGPSAEVLRWLLGRGGNDAVRVEPDGGPLPAIGRWL